MNFNIKVAEFVTPFIDKDLFGDLSSAINNGELKIVKQFRNYVVELVDKECIYKKFSNDEAKTNFRIALQKISNSLGLPIITEHNNFIIPTKPFDYNHFETFDLETELNDLESRNVRKFARRKELSQKIKLIKSSKQVYEQVRKEPCSLDELNDELDYKNDTIVFYLDMLKDLGLVTSNSGKYYVDKIKDYLFVALQKIIP